MLRKKYLLITFFVSQTVLLKAESEYLLKEELFQNIVHRNETLKQLGRQVTPDPFEENIVANKKNGESVTEKIKIFVIQQNNGLSTDKQPQYLLKSEEKIKDLKKKLVAEQANTNQVFSVGQFLCFLGTVGCFHTFIESFRESNKDKSQNISRYDLIFPSVLTALTVGLQYLKYDLQPGIDSCTNSTYAIGTLIMEIQQQQKPGQAAPTDEKVK